MGCGVTSRLDWWDLNFPKPVKKQKRCISDEADALYKVFELEPAFDQIRIVDNRIVVQVSCKPSSIFTNGEVQQWWAEQVNLVKPEHETFLWCDFDSLGYNITESDWVPMWLHF